MPLDEKPSDVLIQICNILGASYDAEYLFSLFDECDKISYLLFKIKEFIGG